MSSLSKILSFSNLMSLSVPDPHLLLQKSKEVSRYFDNAILIACAILKKVPILLCNEPQLGYEDRRGNYEQPERNRKGYYLCNYCTQIKTIQDCDLIVVMGNGKVRAAVMRNL
ncbi:hypothetical protein ACHAW6_004381 [Cyclotella cf. meneghiniana]